MIVFSRSAVRFALAVLVGFSIVLGLGVVYELRSVDGEAAPAALQTEWDTVPEELWFAIVDSGQYASFQGDGCECVYVEVGTVLTDHRGFSWRATPDGWMRIERKDWI